LPRAPSKNNQSPAASSKQLRNSLGEGKKKKKRKEDEIKKKGGALWDFSDGQRESSSIREPSPNPWDRLHLFPREKKKKKEKEGRETR